MKNSLSLSFLFLMLAAVPAPAQNIWPVSFSYWFGYPDQYMPDLLSADHSVAHANQMAGLDDHQLRGLMQNRNQAMSQHELSGYHGPNMLPPVYPTEDEAKAPVTAPPAGTSSNPGPAAAASPTRTTSPFPSTQPAGGAPGTPVRGAATGEIVKPPSPSVPSSSGSLSPPPVESPAAAVPPAFGP